MRLRAAVTVVLVAAAVGLVGGADRAASEGGPVVVRARTIYTVTKGILENAEILVENGRIADVGRKVAVPAGAREYQAAVVIPGMIDAHTHLALRRMGGGGGGGPITAEWKAVDNLDPTDPMIPIAVSGGVTSIITRSGSGIVSSGQSVAVKLRGEGRGLKILKPYVDLKMAVRPLINLRAGSAPATVLGWYAIASEQFRKARVYLQAHADHKAGRTATPPPTDERVEAFAAVLRGEVMVHVHCNYPSEIAMVMHLAREFGFLDRLAFAHAGEAYPIAEAIAKTKAIPVIGPVMIASFLGDDRAHNVVKELMDAGVTTSLQTDKGDQAEKCFREYGAFLIRHGLSEHQALEALTINGAKAMMLADRIGSIEVGKDADLVLMDGPPFDLHAERIDKVLVDGEIEYERKSPRQTATPTPVGPFGPMKGMLKPGVRSFALTGAHLFTVSHGTIAGGTLVVRDGKIAAVQAGGAVPKDVPTVDLGGRVVLPGWVTARAYPNEWMGDLKFQVQNDENLEPIMPELNARFAIDPWFPSFAVLRAIGVTAQNITPGHLNLVGGHGVLIKTPGMDVEQMVRKDPTCLVASLTEESARQWGRNSQVPVTVRAMSEMIAASLRNARVYRDKGAGRAYDQRLEALLPALEGRIPVVVHADRADGIRAALALGREFNLRLIVSGGREAHALASELASARVPVILGDSASDLEVIRGGGRGFSDEGPAILSRAGVKVSFFGASGSRRGMTTGRLGGEPALNAAWVFRNGVPEEEALRMLTLHPAEMFGVADRIGSLDVGKDADFMVLEGHPFDYRVLPQLVVVDGEVVYQKTPAGSS